MVFFGGDLFVDIVCEQRMVVNKLSIELVILNEKEYS